MTLYKATLSILLLSSTIFATEVDSNTTEKKDTYMPAIITPDELKSGVYGGLALSTGYIDAGSFGSNGMLDLSLIAGYNINEYIATEGRATISIAYDNGVDYKDISLFLKPKYEAYSGLNIYSLLGFGKVNVDSINTKDTKSAKTSLQYGIGADYRLKNNFKIFADYTYLGKDSSAKYKNKNTALKSGSFNTGITYDF